jgi:membrane associated rhomboid family serine protease
VPELPVERHLELLGYWPGPDPTGVAAGEVWRLLTVALVHAGFLHIALNGYGIWVVGPEIEAAFGRLRFVLLYVVSALGGGTASYALNNVVGSSVGASGALFGLFGALIVVSRRLRRDTGPLYALLAINLVAGFLLPLIDWRGHLGGLVTGYAVAWILVHAPRGRRVLVQSVGVALVVAVLAGVVAARTAQIQQRAEDCRPAFTSAEAAARCLNEGP